MENLNAPNVVVIFTPSEVNSYLAEASEVRINCPDCGEKALITSRKSLSPQVADLYCACKDAECGHTFVFNLSFKHTLSPSAKQHQQCLAESLLNLDEETRQRIISQVSS